MFFKIPKCLSKIKACQPSVVKRQAKDQTYDAMLKKYGNCTFTLLLRKYIQLSSGFLAIQ